MALLLIIRYILSSENKRRDNEDPADDEHQHVYIEKMDKDGEMIKVKVDKVSLHIISFGCNRLFMTLLTRNFWT